MGRPEKPPSSAYSLFSKEMLNNVEIKKFPSKETHKLMPINIYAQSKLLNEKISNYFCKKYKMKIIGLRFFTIYGKWGRPDMLLMKIFNSIKTKKTLHLNNYGNHYRDFTYIEDAVKIIDRLAYSKFSKNEIFNICSSNPIKILDICNIYKLHGLKYKKVKKHSADVFKTHGDNSKIKNNAEKMNISDIEFQGSSVKIILSNSKYKHFNVTMSDSEFFSKDLKIRDEVSCSWNLSNLHELQ